jgi:D-aminopeptidase
MRSTLAWWLPVIMVMGASGFVGGQGRPRARDLGIQPGAGSPGPLNAITDVAGVRVGHTTIVNGETIRTGVTAILPHSGNLFRDKVAGAVFVGNAFGKLAGSTQVEELGTIESPIVLTNTLSVGTALEAVVRWTLAQPGNENVRSVNGLVGETNDGGLNDIRGLHVTVDHVEAAIRNAREGAVEEGAVGAGTGTSAFGWKGGIGTSSRRVRQGPAAEWTVGVLVQSNYGGRLTIDGVPVWRELTPRSAGNQSREAGAASAAPGAPSLDRGSRRLERSRGARASAPGGPGDEVPRESPDGSCMIVVATDAPLDARDLKRLAARAIFGLARTGSSYSNGSGDFAIAFSTSPESRYTGETRPRAFLPTEAVSGLFAAVLEATEEAVYNSLLKATDTTANGRTVRAIPVEELKAVLKKYGK